MNFFSLLEKKKKKKVLGEIDFFVDCSLMQPLDVARPGAVAHWFKVP